MSTSEGPVPAVGSRWVAQKHRNIAPCNIGKVAVVIAIGMGVGYRYEHDGWECALSHDDFAACFVRHPTPEAKPLQGRFPPQAGDVWMFEDREQVFTGEVQDYGHGINRCWLTVSGGGFWDCRFTDGSITFVRLGPTTSVGSGSTAKAPEVAGMSWDGEWLATHYTDGTVSKSKPTAAEFYGPAIVPDLKALVAKPEARPAYIAPPVTFGASADSWSPAKPKPQRATYASLMASLRAEEGVPEPRWCSGCGRAPCEPRQHRLRDGDTVALMALDGRSQSPTANAKPDPWRPSVDPLFDIPEWNEFGSRKP